VINTTYEDLLFDIQRNFENHSSIAELLPTPEEQIFDINLDTRTVEVPQFLSVRYDHNAEVIYFRCARYLDNVDLVNMVCIIEYINAEGTPGLYWVPYYDINNYQREGNKETPTILIPWVVDKLATKEAGEVTFTVRFYKLAADGKTYLYNMSI
jgi:hypothetical protein